VNTAAVLAADDQSYFRCRSIEKDLIPNLMHVSFIGFESLFMCIVNMCIVNNKVIMILFLFNNIRFVVFRIKNSNMCVTAKADRIDTLHQLCFFQSWFLNELLSSIAILILISD
jgi:hypothetical protein